MSKYKHKIESAKNCESCIILDDPALPLKCPLTGTHFGWVDPGVIVFDVVHSKTGEYLYTNNASDGICDGYEEA